MEKIRSCLLLSPLSRFKGVRPESFYITLREVSSQSPLTFSWWLHFQGLFLFSAWLAVYLMLPFSLFSSPYGPTIMYLVNLVFSKCFTAFWCNLSVGHWNPVSSRTERQDALVSGWLCWFPLSIWNPVWGPEAQARGACDPSRDGGKEDVMAVFASTLFSRETGIHTQECETCVPLQSSDLEEHAVYPYTCLWVTLAEEPLR